MPARGYFVDSNLLVLFVAGSLRLDIIAKHARLEDYTAEDYGLLLELFAPVDNLLLTPNTLTEASNLLRQHGDPERSMLLERLGVLIRRSEEVVVASKDAADGDAFLRHGLTDAVLLRAISEETPLLTVDGNLYQEALATGRLIAVNFEDVRAL